MNEFEKRKKRVIRDLKILRFLSKISIFPFLFGVIVYPLLAIWFDMKGESIALVLILGILSTISFFELDLKFKEEFGMMVEEGKTP